MPNVDFYIIDNPTAKSRFVFTCKLATKALQKQQKMYIHCDDRITAIEIDDLLWSFNDISFIPHALVDTEIDEIPDILIGYDNIPTDQRNILLNLSSRVPTEAADFTRIIEIVCQEPEWKKISREHYKAYQALDFPIESHKV